MNVSPTYPSIGRQPRKLLYEILTQPPVRIPNLTMQPGREEFKSPLTTSRCNNLRLPRPAAVLWFCVRYYGCVVDTITQVHPRHSIILHLLTFILSVQSSFRQSLYLYSYLAGLSSSSFICSDPKCLQIQLFVKLSHWIDRMSLYLNLLICRPWTYTRHCRMGQTGVSHALVLVQKLHRYEWLWRQNR